MQSFVTGSQVYGSPHPNSDIDLVILVDRDDADSLRLEADAAWDKYNYGFDSEAMRFGKLNLILCSTLGRYAVWRTAKDKCVARGKELGRPLTRDEAVSIHKECGV